MWPPAMSRSATPSWASRLSGSSAASRRRASCLGPGEGLQAIHQFHLRQPGLGLGVGGHLVQGLPVGGGRGRVVAGLDRIERRLVQRRQRRRLRFRATRAAGADPPGHAVGGRDLEKFIEQAAYLLFVRAALEERHGLALDHRDGGRHGLHLEGLGKFREHVDVRGPEDQPAVVALDDAFEDVHQLAGAWRIGGPEGDHHGHLGRELHELLEVALGHVHAQRPACVVGRAGCRGRRGTGSRRSPPGRGLRRRAGRFRRTRRRPLFQGGEIDGAAQVQRAGGNWRDRAGSWRSHSSTLAIEVPPGATMPAGEGYLKDAPTRPRVAATSFIGSLEPAGGT